MSNEPVHIVALEPFTDALEELLKVLGKSNQLEILRVSSAGEALQVTQQFLPCIFMSCLIDGYDAGSNLDLIKKLEKNIRSGQLKVLVASEKKRNPAARALSESGVTDYVEGTVPIRTLMFKMNLLIKAISGLRKKEEPKADEKVIFKSGIEEAPEILVQEIESKSVAAVELEEDTFLFKNGKAKKIGSKIKIELEGPAPETGNWVAVKSGEEDVWNWQPLDSGEATEPGSGWIAAGDKPVFNELTKKWELNSVKPRLAFNRGGKEVAKKISTNDNGELMIAEDSRQAKDNILLSRTKALHEREQRIKQILSIQEEEKKAEERKAEEKKLKEREAQDKAKKSKVKPENLPDKEPNETAEKVAKNADTDDWQNEIANSKKQELYGRKNLKNRENEASEDDPSTSLDQENDESNKIRSKDPKKKEIKKREGVEESETPDDILSRMNVESPVPDDERKEMLAQKTVLDEDPASIEEKKQKQREMEEESHALEQEIEKQKKEKREKLKSKKTEEREREKKEEDPKIGAAKKRKELMKQIEEIAKAPAEEVAAEEEAQVRRELELTPGEEISRKELAEKKKWKKVQKLKSLLNEARAAEEEDVEFGELDFDPEAANFTSNKSMDSSPDSGEHALKLEKSNKKRKFSAHDSETVEAFYVDMHEIQPADGQWDESKGYFAYIPQEVYESGFKKIEDLLPIWVFEGEDEPELLIEDKKWKFLGSMPLHIGDMKALPRGVRGLLQNLKEQAQLASGIDPEPDAEEMLEAVEQGTDQNAASDLNDLPSTSVDQAETTENMAEVGLAGEQNGNSQFSEEGSRRLESDLKNDLVNESHGAASGTSESEDVADFVDETSKSARKNRHLQQKKKKDSSDVSAEDSKDSGGEDSKSDLVPEITAEIATPDPNPENEAQAEPAVSMEDLEQNASESVAAFLLNRKKNEEQETIVEPIESSDLILVAYATLANLAAQKNRSDEDFHRILQELGSLLGGRNFWIASKDGHPEFSGVHDRSGPPSHAKKFSSGSKLMFVGGEISDQDQQLFEKIAEIFSYFWPEKKSGLVSQLFRKILAA